MVGGLGDDGAGPFSARKDGSQQFGALIALTVEALVKSRGPFRGSRCCRVACIKKIQSKVNKAADNAAPRRPGKASGKNNKTKKDYSGAWGGVSPVTTLAQRHHRLRRRPSEARK